MRQSLCMVMATIAIALSSCSINPARIRVPDVSGDEFMVTVQFTSVLNLPNGAKVSFEGVTVGAVREIALGDRAADVQVSLNPDAQIPADANASIVQDTVLGDPYIKLSRAPGSTAPFLTDGGLIPASHTSPATSIEDMLSTISVFLGGGSLQQLQDSIQRIKGVLPKTADETRNVASLLATDLRELSMNGTELDQSLASLSQVSSSLRNHVDDIRTTVTDEGATYWTRFGTSAGLILQFIPNVGEVVKNGYWLIPIMDSSSNALEQFGASGADPVQFGWQVNGFADQALLPFMADPRVDIVGVTKPDGTTAETQYARKALGVGK